MKVLSLMALMLTVNLSVSLANTEEVIIYKKEILPSRIISLEKKWTYQVISNKGESFFLKAKKCYNSGFSIGKKRLQKPECIAYLSIKEAIRLEKLVDIEFKIDADNFQNEMLVATIIKREVPLHGYDVQASSYQPTDLKTLDNAKVVFESMRKARRASQCFWRATGWNYDMEKDFGIKSERIYLFFSNSFQYRPENKYKWWFHVAPMVTINGEKFVMDPEFLKGPAPLQDWINYFMCKDKDYKNKNPYTGRYECKEVHDPCQKVDHYSVFDDNQYSRYCYYRITNMYHWQPMDVQKADTSSKVRTGWNYDEVEFSKKNGFPKLKVD